MKMTFSIALVLTSVFAASSALACMGIPTEITAKQIKAVVELIQNDGTVKGAAISSIQVLEEEELVVVTLNGYERGQSIRKYSTKTPEGAPVAKGGCGQTHIERIQ